MSTATRIAILQQTAEDGLDTLASLGADEDKSVLQYILTSDEARNQIENELQSKSLFSRSTRVLVAHLFP